MTPRPDALLPLAALFLMAATLVARAAEPVLVIHGGSGALPRAEMTPDLRGRYENDLKRALRAGRDVLEGGGRSLDAVEAAISVMEDSPLFSAGKGAALNTDGAAELDASLMDGRDRKAGAVAAATAIKNPIAGARAVMDRSPHVLLAGPGADRFARENGLETAEPAHFVTKNQVAALKKKQSGSGGRPKGTVGAVALDRRGDLAAGASTGGLTGKAPGRVGDTALPGAGVFADNRSCAVSCTGDGEVFIRAVAAHEVAALVAYKGLTLEKAASDVIRAVKDLGGEGGLIAVDTAGRFTMPFNSEGMYRGYVRAGGEPHVFIYLDEAGGEAGRGGLR